MKIHIIYITSKVLPQLTNLRKYLYLYLWTTLTTNLTLSDEYLRYRSLFSKRIMLLLHLIPRQLLILLLFGRCLLKEDVMGGGGQGGADFILIGLLDAWCTPLSQWWVCSLRGIGNRHLLGPFLYISETILNTSPILLNFSSSIFSFLDILPSSGLPFSYLFLGLSRNDHRLPTADF